MAKKAYIVTGLGYGDEGKGSIVDWLTAEQNVHTVIRTGGPQALHRVVTSAGIEHVFSQFGSGSLRGAKTHLSRHMLVAPSALLREGELLQSKCNHDVFSGFTIHHDALLVTPIQAVMGRVRELLRGPNRRGSVGVGVGETVRDANDLGEHALQARDLDSPYLAQKLLNLWRYKWSQYEPYADRASGLPEPIGAAIRTQLSLIADDGLLQETVREFTTLARLVRIVDDQYVNEKILTPDGTLVIEGSQGVLLDRVHGFYPYTTKVRSVPDTARDILHSGQYTGEVQSLGILRNYATRHGHGPFVTEDAALTKILPDARNHNDTWQGNFRIGHFDAVATRYALNVCGAQAFDGLVITCLDRTSQLDTWSVCTDYQSDSGDVMSSIDQRECGYVVNDKTQCARLTGSRPILYHTDLRPLSEPRRLERQIKTISDLVHVPVYATSNGATEKDKLWYVR